MTRPVVWDVFPYHNEALLLEIRTRELRDDHRFEIRHLPIEAMVTFTGEPRKRMIDDSLLLADVPGATPVEREEYVRRATKWALDLIGAAPGDHVLFGDVDEIPSADAVGRAITSPGIKCLRLPYHSLLATRRLPLKSDRWNFRWPIIGTYAELAAEGDWAVLRAESGSFIRVENAGWHLSSMGGPDVVLPKIAAFAHAGEDWTVGLDAARLRDLANRGRDVADRFTQQKVGTWELPFALIEDPEAYRTLLEVCW